MCDAAGAAAGAAGAALGGLWEATVPAGTAEGVAATWEAAGAAAGPWLFVASKCAGARCPPPPSHAHSCTHIHAMPPIVCRWCNEQGVTWAAEEVWVAVACLGPCDVMVHVRGRVFGAM